MYIFWNDLFKENSNNSDKHVINWTFAHWVEIMLWVNVALSIHCIANNIYDVIVYVCKNLIEKEVRFVD